MEDSPIKKQQDMTWLEHLQKNSWEPEVIISGISLAFLFVIPSKLFDTSVILIQDYGLEQIQKPNAYLIWRHKLGHRTNYFNFIDVVIFCLQNKSFRLQF